MQTVMTPREAAQNELLCALRHVDELHARRAAGEDVPEPSIHDAYDRIDVGRLVLRSLTPDLPDSPSLTARQTRREEPPRCAS